MVSRVSGVDPLAMDLLTSELAKHRVIGFCFFVLPMDERSTTTVTQAMQRKAVERLRKLHFVITSDDLTLKVWRDYFNQFAHKDSTFLGRRRLGPEPWEPEPSDRNGMKLRDYLAEYGIKGGIDWRIALPAGGIVYYSLLSDVGRQPLSLILNEKGEVIGKLLEIYAHYFLAYHSEQLNPVFNCNVLSCRSIEILNQLSEGLSLDTIANNMHLTSRGVCYHIDKMKDLLTCTNRAQLVHKAKVLGII